MDNNRNGTPNSQHIPMEQYRNGMGRQTNDTSVNQSQPRSPIRLDQPRPETDRHRNDYVDSPPKTKNTVHHSADQRTHFLLTDILTPAGRHTSKTTQAEEKKLHGCGNDKPKKGFDTDHFLTKQPSNGPLSTQKKAAPLDDSSPLKKKIPCAIHGCKVPQSYGETCEKPWKNRKEDKEASVTQSTSSAGGIICPQCGQCRCTACKTPRKLPTYWVCNGNFECSGDNLVEQISCLCCVKGCFYHCTNFPSDDMVNTVDHPCSCYGKYCCSRWTIMGILSVTCLPCLLCYWPCRGIVECCSNCYAKYHQSGCRCRDSSRESSPNSSLSGGNSPQFASPGQNSLNSPSSSTDSSPRPLTRKSPPMLPPKLPPRPGHARRTSSTNLTGETFFR